MQCKFCANSLALGSRFCTHCGNKNISERPSCNNCNQSLPPEAKFCHHCGEKRVFCNNESKLPASKNNQTVSTKISLDKKVINQPLVNVFVLPLAHKESIKLDLFIGTLKSYYQLIEIVFFDTKKGRKDLYFSYANIVNQGKKITSVTILADTDLIPHFNLPDLTQNDSCVLTDNPFGFVKQPELTIENVLIPEFPVSRVPFNQLSAIEKLLIKNDNVSETTWDNGGAFSASAWSDVTQIIISDITDKSVEVYQSPSTTSSVFDNIDFRFMERIHINLHGSRDEPYWYGECEYNKSYPIALTTKSSNYSLGSVLMAECCYGAQTRYERINGDILPSMACHALSNNVRWFIGSTIIAWGAINGGEPSCADELTRISWKFLDETNCGVTSLHYAKQSIAQSIVDSGASPSLINTMLSFVCYGYPQTTTTLKSSNSAKLIKQKTNVKSRQTHVVRESSLDDIRGRIKNKNRFSPNTNSIESIRKSLHKRLANCRAINIEQDISSIDELSRKARLSNLAAQSLKKLINGQNILSRLFEIKTKKETKQFLSTKIKCDDKHTQLILAEIKANGQLENIVSSKYFKR